MDTTRRKSLSQTAETKKRTELTENQSPKPLIIQISNTKHLLLRNISTFLRVSPKLTQEGDRSTSTHINGDVKGRAFKLYATMMGKLY